MPGRPRVLVVQVDELKVPGAWSFTPRQFPDPRGVFLEWFKTDALEQVLGHRLQVAQANHSASARGTLSGVHFAYMSPSLAQYDYLRMRCGVDEGR